MGYDMRIRGEVPQPSENVSTAARALREAIYVFSRAKVDDGYFAKSRSRVDEHEDIVNPVYNHISEITDPDYFRLNVWGMSHYITAMLEIGMMHHSRNPDTDWDSLPEWSPETEDEYDSARDKLTAYHEPGTPDTMPSHKFDSNDGWYVTPEEINASLAAWDALLRSQDLPQEVEKTISTDYWGKWIAFLRLAATHGGFRVH